MKKKMSRITVSPFQSFWMAGFECADHLNAHGNRMDLSTATGHLQLLEQDYQMLRPFNISTVREGIRWSQVETAPYQYDWSAVRAMIETGRQNGIQQIWDICHFGFPDDLTPLHPHFAKRFEALCKAFVIFYRSINPDIPLMVTPINEVSFLSWLGGEVGGTAPYAVRLGWEVKYHLMKAYIRGVAAMRNVDKRVIIITTEPLIHVVPSANASRQDIAEANRMREEQFQSVDILCGKMCPELGGSPDYVDILGFNFYYNNQWSLGVREVLPWAPHDRHPKWIPLHKLLQVAYQRYRKPVAITETSHPGEDRPTWISHIAEECAIAIRRGVPVWGVCIYPIIDRPDWDYPDIWHRSGLWDEAEAPGETATRLLNLEYAEALTEAQQMLTSGAVKVDVYRGVQTARRR